MFEEICLVCGKHLDDDRQAYCSDECQNLDAISPSISSASSTLSSPHLEYAVGGEVPPLVPSVLGSALHIYHRDRHSVSSSSASSASWSVLTDEEDNGALLGLEDETYKASDGSENVSIYEGGSKSGNFVHIRPPGLSYARRPSGTNNRSTVPNLHKRTSSGASTGHVRHGIPRSAPHSSAEEDEDYDSDFGFSSRTDDILHCQQQPAKREWGQEKQKNSTLTTKPKRTHNRASLPGYFSLLQIGSANLRSSPVSSSSGNTVARLSPPTPKLTLAAIVPHSSSGGPLAAIQATPRGRPRESGTSRGSRMSRSRSPENPQPRLSNVNIKSSVEQLFDWSPSGVARGRAAVRRNSSPPAKMLLPAIPGGLPESSLGRKARMTAAELDGVGVSADPPHRRGGLLKRERGIRGDVTLR